MYKKELSIHATAAALSKAAGAQDRAGTCSHSPCRGTQRNSSYAPGGGSKPPCFLSASSPSSKPIISPLQPCPGFVGRTSAEVPLAREPRATTWIPPVLRVPPSPHRQSCQSRSHVSRLIIPPDAGRENLNKTPWQDDIKKGLSCHS